MKNDTQNFISKCVSEIINSNANISTAIFVLPSKRASVFLRKELAMQINKTIFLPKIISIEEFIEEISDLKTASNLETLFVFYKVYGTIIPAALKEPFESFSKWAQVLLHDFNEIDRYKINAKDFFNNLSNIKQLEKWNVGEEPTELIKNYLNFWKNSYRYYAGLKETMLQDGVAYQGLVYREASNQIEHYIEHNTTLHYFLGFNALNTSEELIFQELLQQGLATVFWDSDAVFFKNKTHIASHFLRKYKAEWKHYEKHPFSFVTNDFQNEKEISVFALPKNISQAKKVGELLRNLSANELKETAVVLGDETLLLPVLNSLPKNVTDVNITMGLSLKDVPLTAFFESIFQLYVKQSGTRFYYKRLLNFLNNNYTKIAIGNQDVKSIIAEIHKYNHISLSADAIEEMVPNNGLLQKILSLKKASVLECLSVFNEIILQLKANLSESKDRYLLDLEYLYRFNKVFNKVKVLQEKHQILNDVSGLYQIYKEVITTETLDFKGEPVKGLQIMGMLETRVLDFKRVILTSVNEGVLPSGKSHNSFIPFDLKIAFQLPTYFDKDAVYGYHFFKLLQRAKYINLLYNTVPDVLNAGEKSRFLLQLEAVLSKNHVVNYETNSPAIHPTITGLKVIAKDESVLTRLKEIASLKEYVNDNGETIIKGGFSPSALTQYVRNPIDFYTQKILRIYEEDEVEETVAANTLGTIVHNTFEEFYKPLEGQFLTENLVKQMQLRIQEEVKKQFILEFKKGDITKGKNLIIYNVAIRYVSNFLKEELKLLKNSKEVIIHKIEAPLRIQLPFKSTPFPVYLSGLVDRIDEVDGVVRVIDYKTGKVLQSEVTVKDWGVLLEDYKKGSKPFQILAYAYMMHKDPLFKKPVEAGIISFKNLQSGFLKFKDGKESVITPEIFNKYLAQLELLINEILDVKTPFTEKEI